MAASHLYKVTHGKGRKQPKRRQKHCNFSHIGASSRFRKTSTGKPRLPFIQIPPALSQPACGFALSCPCVLQFQNMMHFFSLSTTLWKRFNAQCKRRKTKKYPRKKTGGTWSSGPGVVHPDMYSILSIRLLNAACVWE